MSKPRFEKHTLRAPTHGVMSVRLSLDEQRKLAQLAEWYGLPDQSSALRLALSYTHQKTFEAPAPKDNIK